MTKGTGGMRPNTVYLELAYNKPGLCCHGMARYAQNISADPGENQGAASARHVSMGALALCYPAHQVQAIIDECGRGSKRVRALPMLLVAYYVMALNLFPAAGYQSVLGWLLAGLRWLKADGGRLSTKGALSAARLHLGPEPLRLMHERMAAPLADPGLAGSYWKGWHVVALDGSTLALQDTPANAAVFGRPGNQHGQGAYPLARFAALAEVGTHLIFAARLGAYQGSELTLAKDLIPQLKRGMLCLADRLFPGYDLWKEAAATGAHLLWRAKMCLPLEKIRDLPDGSWVARWRANGRGSHAKGQDQTVRVIEYRLRSPRGKVSGQAAPEETYRLITTILDPQEAGAEELAGFYPQR